MRLLIATLPILLISATAEAVTLNPILGFSAGDLRLVASEPDGSPGGGLFGDGTDGGGLVQGSDGKLYMTVEGSTAISRIDPVTGNIEAQFTFPTSLPGNSNYQNNRQLISIVRDGSRLYVTDINGELLSVNEDFTAPVFETFDLGGNNLEVYDMELVPAGFGAFAGDLIAIGEDTKQVIRRDLGTGIETKYNPSFAGADIPPQDELSSIAFSRDGLLLYAVHEFTQTIFKLGVSDLDGSLLTADFTSAADITAVTGIPSGARGIDGIAVNPATGEIAVTVHNTTGFNDDFLVLFSADFSQSAILATGLDLDTSIEATPIAFSADGDALFFLDGRANGGTLDLMEISGFRSFGFAEASDVPTPPGWALALGALAAARAGRRLL